MMPYLTFNFYPTVMVEKNDNAFCDHSAFAFNFGSIDQVALGHGLKMTHTMPCVYSNLLYSVDLRENPMFTGSKTSAGAFGQAAGTLEIASPDNIVTNSVPLTNGCTTCANTLPPNHHPENPRHGRAPRGEHHATTPHAHGYSSTRPTAIHTPVLR